MHEMYTVTQVRVDNYRTKTLVFDRPIRAQPGQFVMAWLPDVDEKPFSIAGDDPLALTVVAVGPFSEQLHRLQVGGRVWVRGPFGHGFHVPGPESPSRLLLVGGGYGVAPLHFLARKAVAAGHDAEVCIGARTGEDILLSSEFAREGVSVRLATEDGSRGTKGWVTQIVDEAIHQATPDAVYGCGPLPMLSAVEVLCKAHDLPHQLSWEAHMRCGIGLCGACEVHELVSPGWLACLDGPVSSGPAS
jgi:dihydroorotate dehydrogenase electron transfer subunit